MVLEHFGTILAAYELPYSLYMLFIRYAEITAKQKQEELKKLEQQVKQVNRSKPTTSFKLPFT